jgi:hypothetical protein
MAAVVEYFEGNGDLLRVTDKFICIGMAGKNIEVPQILGVQVEQFEILDAIA